jgi:hypothetical protein
MAIMKTFYILHRQRLQVGGNAMCDVVKCDSFGKVLSTDHLCINEGLHRVEIEWGVPGTGAFNLSYYILKDFDDAVAENMYTAFTYDVITKIPMENTFRILADWQIEKYLARAKMASYNYFCF